MDKTINYNPYDLTIERPFGADAVDRYWEIRRWANKNLSKKEREEFLTAMGDWASNGIIAEYFKIKEQEGGDYF